MTENNCEPTSSKSNPVIKIDLISPLKALEIYQRHLLTVFNDRISCAKRDLKECNLHINDPLWGNERLQAEEKLRVCKDLKQFLYIPGGVIPQIEGKNYYFTRELRENQKKSFAWRNQVILRDNFKCRKCALSAGLEAHHIYSYKNEPSMRYDINNGVTLCFFCHKDFHKKYGHDANMNDLISFLGIDGL